MKVIIGGRGSGKTIQAVRHSAESGRKIVVMSKQQEKLILETAEYLGIKDLPKPIVLSENNIGAVGHRDEVILENANVFLREIFGLNVKAITLDSDDVVNLNIENLEVLNRLTKNSTSEYKYNRAVDYLEDNWSDGSSEPRLETIIINDLVNIIKKQKGGSI